MRPTEKYKMSHYNVFHQDGGVQYMWNTYSGALLKLDSEAQEYTRKFSGIDDGSKEFNILKDSGFIVYEQLDEFGRVSIEEKRALFSNKADVISFVIAPGMGCNYSCAYCFEAKSDKTGVMTPETAIDVADFICTRMQENPNLSELHIRWFGGEPLLYMRSMEIISRKLVEYTKQNDIRYSTIILTNGRYLDENTLEKLQELCIYTVNITMDGTCETYCRSKGALAEDYDCVVENICRAAQKVEVSVRLNIPNNDANEAIKLSDYLLSDCGLLGKAGVYFACVYDYSLPPDMSRQTFINFAHNHHLWACHMNKRYGISETHFLPPKRRLTSCRIIREPNTCIGPDGELYKCEHSFGVPSMVTGNIWQGSYYNNAELAYYTTVDVANNVKCSQCEFYPVCLGGCANDRVNGFVGFDCEDLKTFLHKKILFEGGVLL